MELLHGKDGFFRKHMLGRRVHYSGRTAITPVPALDIEHVLLPVDVGLKWFADKIDLKLSANDFNNLKLGDYGKRKAIASTLNTYVKAANYLVLLNRQPSLHRHSIQSFYPLFWEHYSIGFPSLICEGFGADFDGDTMAFYFPVSQFTHDDTLREEVRKELEHMLPTNNPYRLGDRGIA